MLGKKSSVSEGVVSTLALENSVDSVPSNNKGDVFGDETGNAMQYKTMAWW